MDLVLLWVACVFVFLFHEFGHFVFAVLFGKFKGFFFNKMFCGIDLKFPVPLEEWYAIIVSGVVAGFVLAVVFPVDLPIETIFLICFALTISILDILLVWMVQQEEKTNPFFKEITSNMCLSVEFRQYRTGENREV